MKRHELTLAPGGLMRCCTDSLHEWITANPDAEVKRGDMIECRHERKKRMVVDERFTVRWIGSKNK